MAHCINHSHSEVVALAKAINLHPALTASKIAVWQETHNVYDRFPTVAELNTRSLLPESNEGQSLEELLGGMEDKVVHETSFKEEVKESTKEFKLSREKKDEILIKGKNKTIPSDYVLHSGGANGADTQWEKIGIGYGLQSSKHYYVHGNKSPRGNTYILQSEAKKVDNVLEKVNKVLKRKFPTSNEFVNNLLRRNVWQVKLSDAVFAISTITNGIVDGGTAWAVHLAILDNKPVYVFDQNVNKWFTWKNEKFIETKTPTLTKNFAGIGTREINQDGIRAIKDVYEKSSSVQDFYEEGEHASDIVGVSAEGNRTGRIPYGYQHKITNGKVITLNDQQVDGLNMMFEFEQLPANTEKGLSFLLAGFAGCLGIGTKVLMFDGSFKNVEDVVVGDQLMGIDSTPRNVLELKRGVEQMYWVHQKKGMSYRVNESHILSLKKHSITKYRRFYNEEGKRTYDISTVLKPSVIETHNVSVRELLEISERSRRYYKGYCCEELNFPETTIEVDPYYVGLWLGDGTTRDFRQVSTEDFEIIEYLSTFGKLTQKDKYTYYIKGTELGIKMKNLFNLPRQGVKFNKFIPKTYLINSKEVRLKLLAGLIDSDGYFNKTGKYYEITQKSEQLAKDIVYLTKSLGFKTKIKEKTILFNGKFLKYYRVTFSPECEIPVKLERKRFVEKSDFKNRLHTGISIEKDTIDDYYGFVLDGDHLFMLEDFTVTHNTGKTTVTKVFVDAFKGKVAVSAPTHKAKKVAAKAIGKKAETIHSLLGLRPNVDLENFDVNNPQFDPLVEPTIGDYSLVVVDEASMINKGLYKLLMEKAGKAGTKILFMGDNAQLPPINETQSLVFTETKNNVWLTKVERTADDNPLRSIFTKIRENLFSQKDAFEHKTELLADGRGVEFMSDLTDFTRSVYGTFTSEEFKKDPFNSAKLIAWKNDAVGNWNRGIRSAIFGKDARIFEKGDLIMAYTNIKGKTPGAPPEFENSADYKVIEVSEGMEDGMKMFYLTLKDDSDNITTRRFIDHNDSATVKEFQRMHNILLETAKNTKGSERGRVWGSYYSFRENHLTMAQLGTISKSADYAYSVTSHKSQGSTYKKVYVLENNIDGNPTIKERNQMKYVAFTRASDTVVSFTSKAEQSQSYEEEEHAFDLLPGVKNYKTGIDYGIVGDTVDRQIKRLYERLSQLNRQEATTKDVVALKGIRKEIFKLLAKIDEKKLQLDEAKQAKRLEELAIVLKEQLKEAKDIVDNNPLLTPDQIAYFRKVVNLIIAAGDFSGDDHILFSDIEMQSPYLRNLFEGMAREAAELARVVDRNTKRLMEQFVANKTGKEMEWKDFVEMIEDASGLKTNTLNLSRMNNPLLSSIFIEMKEMQFAAHKSAQEIFDKTDELIERALPILKQLNPSDPFKLFKQVTKNGKLIGNLTFRYSHEFSETKRAIWSGAFNQDGTVNKLGYATALAWGKDNTITFDVRKLFPTRNTDSFQWSQTFSNAEVQSHIAELKQQLGEEGYNTLYAHLEKKMERFQMLHEVVTSEIMNNPTVIDKQLQLEYWEKSNSPYWACESRTTGSLIKIGPNVVSTEGGAKYTHNVPRRVTLQGKKTEWYDKQFEQIESNPALLEFYNYFLETLGMLNKMIPAYKREGYQINTLPTVRKEILEMFRDNPASMGKELWGKVIEATRVDDLSITDYSEIDPLTGKGDPRIAFHNVDTKQAIKDLTNVKRVEWEQANPGIKPTLKEARKWKEEATHEIASKKSYDLGKVLRAYSMQVLSYHHKASTENLINLAVNAFNNISEIEVNSAGEAMTNQRDFLRKKQGLENLKELLNYQQRVYANLARHDVELKTETKVFTPEEKAELKHLNELEATAEEQLASGKIDQSKYNSQVAIIETKREKLGGLRVGSKIGDMVLQWVQLLGMGWNLVGSFANRVHGKLANWTEASDGRLFGLAELCKAEMLTLNSVGKNLTFNHWKGVNGMALKIRNLMDKFDVLQETRNELYKSSTGSRFLKKFLWLNPYQLNTRTEYLNQSEAFIARLLRLKVSDFLPDYTGTESLWDAFDKDGNWNIPGVEEPDLTSLRVKIDNMVNRLHGDYSNVQKGKKSLLGRSLFQFRSWMPEMFFARFGSEWEDHIEGITRKGRYRSMTPLQHLMTAGIFTGVAFGAPGFLIGAGVGVLTGKAFGMKSPMNMAEELLFNIRILARKAQFSDKFTETDAANMRANMMELTILMSLYGFALIVKAAFGDDDEDYTKYAVNLMLNQMTRMQTDILFYTNPLEFEKLSKNALPVFGLVADTYHWIDAVQDTVNGEGEYKSGLHKGDSKIARYTRKLLPGLKQGDRWFSAIEQQYKK